MPRQKRAEARAAKAAAAEGRDAVRKDIAGFIAAFAIILAEAHNFTIRGDCELGFCLTTMLTVEEYSAVLLTGQFVTLKARGDSFNVQTTHYHIWNEFLKDNELHGPGNVAEATVSTVKKVEAFKRRKKGAKIGETRRPIHTLRIGLEGDGEATIASRQLTLGIDPLNFQQD